jgi:hypothetical protein
LVIERRNSTVAATAVLCAVGWLALNVQFNYGGRISGLFYTGSKAQLPPEVDAGHTYRVNDKVGYDAAFYHLIAHDPLNRRGFLRYVDNPRLRWRRIGVPGLAALLAAGNDDYVDYVYVAVEVSFVFLGAFWLSRYAQRQGKHALWGLTFLLIPSVAVSLDRMTVDLPLAALSIGLVYYGTAGAQVGVPRWPVYIILAAAPLVRETGMILVLGWCMHSVWLRQWRAASLGAASALPAMAWWAYVHSHTPIDGTSWLSSYPFSGIISRTIQGIDAPNSTFWLRAAAGLEEVALIGMWLALILAVSLAWRWRWGLIEVIVMIFVAFAAALGSLEAWSSAYATGRSMSPLLIMLGLLGWERGRVFALPLVLVLPRIALQYEAQLKGALRAFF